MANAFFTAAGSAFAGLNFPLKIQSLHGQNHYPDDMLQAIDLQQEYQLSFWDAMIVQSASRLGCIRLYSEDFSHGQFYAGVQAINPLRNE